MSCHKSAVDKGPSAALSISVLLFGSFRERVGREKLDLQFLKGATASDVLIFVCGDNEDAARWQRCMRVAVNCKYVPHDTPLNAGDEVALIPPVAGG